LTVRDWHNEYFSRADSQNHLKGSTSQETSLKAGSQNHLEKVSRPFSGLVSKNIVRVKMMEDSLEWEEKESLDVPDAEGETEIFPPLARRAKLQLR
jgi:hypothetical protein